MAHGITQRDTMFSVRETPWHGKGSVLETYPRSIDEALDKSGLLFGVRSVEVEYVLSPEWTDDFGMVHPKVTMPAVNYRGNIRVDPGTELIDASPEHGLGIVSDDYKIVDNRDAFRFLDSLINSDLHFETAGSIAGGRKVWVLARLPEWIELGGDQSGTYVFVANGHDGSMAVTAGVTPIRIVCQNTLGAALRRTEYGDAAARTYKFRHTGKLEVKFAEARKVMGMTLNYEKQFKALADGLALERMTSWQLEERVLKPMYPIDDDMGTRAKNNRERTIGTILDLFGGKGPAGDTTGNSPYTKWSAYNAIGEYLDYGRRYTKATDQVARSFGETPEKQRALDLILAA